MAKTIELGGVTHTAGGDCCALTKCPDCGGRLHVQPHFYSRIVACEGACADSSTGWREPPAPPKPVVGVPGN